jgi:hypothetical protein
LGPGTGHLEVWGVRIVNAKLQNKKPIVNKKNQKITDATNEQPKASNFDAIDSDYEKFFTRLSLPRDGRPAVFLWGGETSASR